VQNLRSNRDLVSCGWGVGYQFCLDRISIPGVNLRGLKGGPFSKELTPFLEKGTGYRPLETDPFRYVSDETPNIWASIGATWMPDTAPLPVLIRVVVGQDLVGEWKAKNGK
ncbi:MAG: hypothetical protein IKO55_18195, partial [Kiritimatiellae bacterium]|nr:hypothetical protein [Kiritimatiellia bacterium]